MRWFLLDCGHYATSDDEGFKWPRGREAGWVKCRVCSLAMFDLSEGRGVMARLVKQLPITEGAL